MALAKQRGVENSLGVRRQVFCNIKCMCSSKINVRTTTQNAENMLPYSSVD